jgi:hypothetical protein
MKNPPNIKCNISSLITSLYRMVLTDGAYPTPRKDYRSKGEHIVRTDKIRTKIRALIDLIGNEDAWSHENERILEIHDVIGVWNVKDWNDISAYIGRNTMWVPNDTVEGYVVVSLSEEGIRYLNGIARWVSPPTDVTV